NPPTPFAFDVPTEALGTTVLEGSTPQAGVTGRHVLVQPPFPPGRTLVELTYQLPAESGTATVTQKLPANLEEVGVIVKKVGDVKVSSPLFARQEDVSLQGEVFAAGTGASVNAGQPIMATVTGVPHHSTLPRWITLGLAAVIIGIGVWMSGGPDDADARAE